jgi:hypothetical protein
MTSSNICWDKSFALRFPPVAPTGALVVDVVTPLNCYVEVVSKKLTELTFFGQRRFHDNSTEVSLSYVCQSLAVRGW